MFNALTSQIFYEIRDGEKTAQYNLLVIDLGYAQARNKSCGLAWKTEDGTTKSENLNFENAVMKVRDTLLAFPKARTRLLVIEAPLSMCHDDGCPTFRGTFEGPRKRRSKNGKPYWPTFGWYHAPAASVTLGAIRFLTQLSRLWGTNGSIYLAEAFLSDKARKKTDHRDDAKRTFTTFFDGDPEVLKATGIEPISTLILGGIPLVRLYR
jgi:hypothetical protein